MADAGDNKDKMADVLAKATKQAEEAGAKSSQETFNGLTLHILREAPDDKDKEKDAGEGRGQGPDMSLAWTQSESIFYFTLATPGSEIEVIKDLTAHREGRDNSLASNESFTKTQAKIESGKAQVVWFLDVAKLVKLALKASAKGNEGQAQQNEVLLQQLGVNGLKSVGGSFTIGAGSYDSAEQDLLPRAQARPGRAQDLLVPAGPPPARVVGPGDGRLLPDVELGPRQCLRRDRASSSTSSSPACSTSSSSSSSAPTAASP